MVVSVPVEWKKRLRLIGIDQERSADDLIKEGIEHILSKYPLSPETEAMLAKVGA